MGYNLCTCAFKCFCAVVFTVRSGEYRDEYGRLRYFILAYINVIRLIQTGFYCVRALDCLCREYLFQRLLPRIQRLFFGKGHVSIGKYRFCRYRAEQRISNIQIRQTVCRNFCYQIAKAVCKQLLCRNRFLNCNAKSVTERHAGQGCCHTIAVQCICGNDHALAHQLGNLCIQCHYLLIIRQIVGILLNGETNQTISSLF